MRPVCGNTIAIYRDGRVRLPANFKLGNKPVAITYNPDKQQLTFRPAEPGEIIVLKPYYATGKGFQGASPVLSMRRIFRTLEISPEEISGTYEPKILNNGLVIRWRKHGAV